MRKIALFTLAAALLGTVAAAQASDRRSTITDGTGITRTASHDDDDRYERANHRRDRDHETNDRRHDSHDDRDEDEGREHRR
jgi:hypothetical protein